MQQAVKRGLGRRKTPQSARHLCVDEVAFKKGHQYVTVISDTQGQSLALRDDRGVESLAGYLRSPGDRQVESVDGHESGLYQRGADPAAQYGGENHVRSLPCSENALCRR
ncbi:transposase [Erwinia tracheiphila PSU-1]|nr:transposase [Erwinia tracheiphila PSU-1]